MSKVILVAAMLFITTAQADVCHASWTGPKWRDVAEGETPQPITTDEIKHFRIYIDIDGPGEPTVFELRGGVNTNYSFWWDGDCPKCPRLLMTAIDNDGRESVLSDKTCAPQPPGVCER